MSTKNRSWRPGLRRLAAAAVLVGAASLGLAAPAHANAEPHSAKVRAAIAAQPASASATSVTCNTSIPGGTLYTTVRVSGDGAGWWAVGVSQYNDGIRRVYFTLDRLVAPTIGDVVHGPDSIGYHDRATWGRSTFLVNGLSAIKVSWYDLRGNKGSTGCGLLG